MSAPLSDKLKWFSLALGSAFIASFAVKNLIRAGWRTFTDDDPPLNPASLETDWNEAITWTVVTGIAAGLTRLIVRRGAAATWHNVTGALPPSDRVAVNLFSDVESDIRPRRSLLVNARPAEATGAADTAPLELWPWLAAVALVLLVLEWFVYCLKTRG